MVYRIFHVVLAAAARLYWRLEVRGLENVPREGAVLVASNHLSFIDSIVIPLAMPRRVTFLAKSEYFTGRGLKGRAMALFFRGIGAVPVERGGSRDALAALGTAQAVLGEGGAFGIYPEGTRSRDGRLYRGRTGVAWLALTTGAPVLPVALRGTNRVQPIGSNMIRPRKVVVTFGPVVDPGDLLARLAAGDTGPGPARRKFADAVMAAIAAMSGQEQVNRYNTPAAGEEPVSP